MSTRDPWIDHATSREQLGQLKELTTSDAQKNPFSQEKAEGQKKRRLSPEHFVLWSAGVLDIIGERQPTPEEWALLREQLRQSIAGVVSNRLLNTPYVQPFETFVYTKEATTSDRLV